MDSSVTRLGQATAGVIEQLERRQMLSAVSTSVVAGQNVLKITGTTSADWVTIYDDPSANKTTVVDDKNRNNIADAGELFVYNKQFQQMNIDLGKGDDKLTIQLLGDINNGDRALSAKLGAGKDNFLFNSPALFGPALKNIGNVNVSIPLLSLGGADIVDDSYVSMSVDGQEDADLIEFDLSRTSIRSSTVTIKSDAGSGDDIINFTTPDFRKLETGISNSLLQNVNLLDDAFFSLINDKGSKVDATFNLGTGTNTLTQTVNTLITGGSDVSIKVNGSTGKDYFRELDNFKLYCGSTYNVTASLGSNDDKYFSEMQLGSSVLSLLDCKVSTLADLFLGGISIDHLSKAKISIDGGDGNDHLVAKDVKNQSILDKFADLIVPIDMLNSSPINGLFDVSVKGGKGNDSAVRIDYDHDGKMSVGLFGTFAATADGGDGNDTVHVSAHVSILSLGQYDLRTLGGAGNDKLAMHFQNDNLLFNSLFQYGPNFAAIIDGGPGSDRWDTEGNPVVKVTTAETLDESIEPTPV